MGMLLMLRKRWLPLFKVHPLSVSASIELRLYSEKSAYIKLGASKNEN